MIEIFSAQTKNKATIQGGLGLPVFKSPALADQLLLAEHRQRFFLDGIACLTEQTGVLAGDE